MNHRALRSLVGLLAAPVLVLAGCGSSPESLSSPNESHRAALSDVDLPVLDAQTLASTPGPLFITGHDPDFHAPDHDAARHLLSQALAYVRHGSAKPFVWVESRITPPDGHRPGKSGLVAIGMVEGRDFVHLDGSQLAGKPLSWWISLGQNFSAVAVASDFGGILTQAELDQLNAHRSDLATFVNGGGGLMALSESGTQSNLTQHDRFKFLPIDVGCTATASPPYSVTAYAQTEFGLTDADVDDASHSHFDADFGLNVVSRSAPTGQIMALAGRVQPPPPGFVVANAGPDQTLDATLAAMSITLDGSGSSTDAAAAPLHYTWVEAGVVLADTDSATAVVSLGSGVHTVTLTVTNARGEKASDDVVITLRSTLPPPSVTMCEKPPFVRNPLLHPGAFITATAQGASIAQAFLTLNGGEPLALTLDPNDGSTGVDVTLREGPNRIEVTAIDTNGSRTTKSETVVLDTVAPVVTFTAPAAGAAMASALVPVSIAVADQTPTTAVVQQVSSASFPSGSGSFSTVINVVNSGLVTIGVTATDAAGNSASATVTVLVDPNPPRVSTNTLSDGARFGKLTDDALSYTFYVSSAEATHVAVTGGATYDLPRGGGQVQTRVPLVEGSNAITVTATDELGRTGALTRTVTYDVTAPTSTVSLSQTGATVSGSLGISAVIKDALTGVKTAWFDVDGSGTTGFSTGGDGTYTGTLNTLNFVDGTHVLNVTATDAVGNRSVTRLSFTVHNAAP